MTARSMIVVLVILFALCATISAGAMPIPGKLMVIGTDLSQDIVYFMEGTTDNVTSTPLAFYNGDIAPNGDEVAYIVGVTDIFVNIWKAGIDGSSPVNLTEAASLTGVNCFPRWSPDGGEIAFQHSEPHTGQIPCEAGFHLWIMDADGSGARPLTPPGFADTTYPVWMSNGSRLLCEGSTLGIIFIDTDGTNVVSVPNVGATPALSPDGSKIVSSTFDYSASQHGTYRRLVVTNVDGSNPQVLLEQFISDADVVAHLEHIDLPTDDFHKDGLICNIGPVEPQWSPTGDLIVFSAAMPLQVQGPHYDLQREVWMYSFATGQATRITTNSWSDSGFSWHGDNTYPDHPQITVDSVTLTFSEVTGSGLTTILLDVDPPEAPSDQFTYDCYDVATTAGVSGDIEIRITYTEDEVPIDVLEADLAVLHYNESSGQWDDITVSRDPVNHEVYGVTSALSLFTLHGVRRSRFSDVPAWGSGEGGLDPYWAFWEIEACAAAGIVGGYEDGTYQPGSAVDRATMAVYVARALAGGEGNVPPGPAEATFDDVSTDSWAFDHVEYCYAQNVVQGYTPTTYAPTMQVTRDQMAVYVARAMVAPTGEAALADYVPFDPRNFPDVPSTGYGDDGTEPFWAYTHIEYCVEHGVVAGYEDGLYHPEIVVTRDQMAVYVARAFGLVD